MTPEPPMMENGLETSYLIHHAATRYPILFLTKLLPVTQVGNNLSNDLDQISKKLKEDRKAGVHS